MVNDERVKWKITSKLQKGQLLAAVNCLAGLAIFFFGKRPLLSCFYGSLLSFLGYMSDTYIMRIGYDQGMMGGVNGSQSYLEIMGLGYMENGEAVVTGWAPFVIYIEGSEY